jgi:hypothetical protein
MWRSYSLRRNGLSRRAAGPSTPDQLRADPNYKPQYVNFPIEWKAIDVVFSNEEFMEIWKYRGTKGDTNEEVVRTLFFHWYLDNRKKQGLRLYTPKQSHA